MDEDGAKIRVVNDWSINRLIDPGRRIEYNFLGSINRKAASTRGHAEAAGAQLCRDTRTRAQDRVHVPTTINIETSCARPPGGRKAASLQHADTRARGTTLREGRWHVDYIWRMA